MDRKLKQAGANHSSGSLRRTQFILFEIYTIEDAYIDKQHENVRTRRSAVSDRSMESTCPRIRLIFYSIED